nr:MAG TPA: hypothetical protein [Caudoviricetes sp.]
MTFYKFHDDIPFCINNKYITMNITIIVYN